MPLCGNKLVLSVETCSVRTYSMRSLIQNILPSFLAKSVNQIFGIDSELSPRVILLAFIYNLKRERERERERGVREGEREGRREREH